MACRFRVELQDGSLHHPRSSSFSSVERPHDPNPAEIQGSVSMAEQSPAGQLLQAKVPAEAPPVLGSKQAAASSTASPTISPDAVADSLQVFRTESNMIITEPTVKPSALGASPSQNSRTSTRQPPQPPIRAFVPQSSQYITTPQAPLASTNQTHLTRHTTAAPPRSECLRDELTETGIRGHQIPDTQNACAAGTASREKISRIAYPVQQTLARPPLHGGEKGGSAAGGQAVQDSADVLDAYQDARHEGYDDVPLSPERFPALQAGGVPGLQDDAKRTQMMIL